MKNIAVFVSGGGTNLQALLDAQKDGIIKSGKITLVISSNETAYALTRAKNAGLKTEVINKKEYKDESDVDITTLRVLWENDIDICVLAGYLSKLGPKTIAAYENKIINVHPSLIPAFCGQGYYGLRVHEAALEYGVKVTGATVHFVDEIYDNGKIIMQKAVDIMPHDTAETLQKRVMEHAEQIILPVAVEMVCAGDI